ncbi:hypothetical protein [Kribbella monticola]|uniref:hypothetical protein n=1 Tax=Kribbella monticola TaxID=2185285 RepID=UPI0013008D66|nr:hypothetical protein [Kribbella monticola]
MDWVGGGGLVVGVLALVVAVFALVIQRRTHREALEAQAVESREGRRLAEMVAREDREHALAMAREDRLWAQRADLYSRIVEAMRSRVEDRTDGPSVPPSDDPGLTSLVTQAQVLASTAVRELLNEFVYADAGYDDQVNIWDNMQTLVKHELGIPRD